MVKLMRDFIRKNSGLLIIILIVLIQMVLNVSITVFSGCPIDWFGLFSNVVLLIFTNYFICKISNKLFRSQIYSMFLCIINGFSAIFFASKSYSITYELSNLFILMIAYIHLVLWRKKKINILWFLTIIPIIAIGNLVHFSFLIFAFCLFTLYILKCVKNKNYKILAKYTSTVLIGFILSLIMGHFLYKAVPLESNLINSFSISNITVQKLEYFLVVNYGFFYNLLLLFIICIGLICYKKKTRHLRKNSQVSLFCIPVLIYLIFVIVFTPTVSIEFLIPVCSVALIMIFYIAQKFLFEHLKNGEAIFLLILLATIYFYNYITGCLNIVIM